jgi:alpha-tubulin suppressor-like RCC1 family protein
VTAGGAHTCVVLAGGSASCWGLNEDKQLGAKTPLNFSFTPVTVAIGSSLTKQIAAGAYHTCAIVAADSTVLCWGSNSDGQLGNPGGGGLPAAEVQTTDPGCNVCPPTAALLNKVTTIAASIGVGYLVSVSPPFGGYHTVALDSSGIDWGWGNNNDGQLVAGAGGGFAMADPSPPSPTLTKIAAGAYHTCILVGPAGIFCRGNNNDVQSGPAPPGFVPGTTLAVDVAAGGYHTCAVIVTPTTPATGSVACWGRNWEGEVDGTSQGPDVPAPELLTVP